MGLDYHHFQVFALRFKPRTVSKPELETFLAAHPEYRWDSIEKILYPAATYQCFWSDRLNGWKRCRAEPEWAEEDDEVEPFLGLMGIPTPNKSPEPDFEAAQEAFGDRLLVSGWVEVGYTC